MIRFYKCVNRLSTIIFFGVILTLLILQSNSSNGTDYDEIKKIVASDRGTFDRFGESVSISGDHAIVGAWLEDEDVSGGNFLNGAGSAYIYERNGLGVWSEVQKIVASDRASFDQFGNTVSISGNYTILGVSGEDEDALGGIH